MVGKFAVAARMELSADFGRLIAGLAHQRLSGYGDILSGNIVRPFDCVRRNHLRARLHGNSDRPQLRPLFEAAGKLFFAANPVIAMHHGKPTLMVRIGNGRAGMLADAIARLNLLLSEIGINGEVFHRVQELRLERAHLPLFPLFWTLMHVVDERSRLHGYDAARAVEADAQMFLSVEARVPTLATTVHDLRNYSAREVRFSMRYSDAVTTAKDGHRFWT
jgi:hypothetical protein